MSKKTVALDNYKLDDRYTQASGRVFISGIQALVRLPLLQRALDKRDGRDSAGLISGYRGSPLGGYDLALWQAKEMLEQEQIDFVPAINEDLATNIISGSQQVETDPEKTVDGVFGIWYGKGPGVDRSADGLKHGNAYGSSPNGGVLVIAGDDHGCVSSSMPHQSDVAFISWFMPVLNPASISEYFEFGLWGIALSRFSGTWVGFKAISETVESSASVDLEALPEFQIPKDFQPTAGGLHYRWPDLPGPHIEQRIESKLEAVQAFARANSIDRRLFDLPDASYGIVTTGKGHLDLMEALRLLDLDEPRLKALGIDIYKVGMVWPLERQGIMDFVHGKKEILVVEEKRGIIESQIKEYMSEPDHPGEVVVVGKQDELGEPMIPFTGELSPGLLTAHLANRLPRYFELNFDSIRAHLNANIHKLPAPDGVRRLPYFCSGCPHNTSTRIPEGSKAQAGIGCHVMATWMGRNTESLSQMGGEGVNWSGRARFCGNGHVFQNLGEGTYFHSGSMAIRQSIASGVNITYKILFNDAVAMTGGQPVDGSIDVPGIARQVAAEGVKRIVIVSDEPEKYPKKSNFPADVSIHHRDEMDSVQRELRETKGTTVLIYDQVCAAEKRRRRKRGKFPDPARRVMINHHVCEDCGDCSDQSNCLAVVPRDTALGRKRRIDQSSCNKDFSCLNGFCPSLVTIEGGQLRKNPAAQTGQEFAARLQALPQPESKPVSPVYDLLISGVGGTGIVTVGALITMAAHLESKGASVLDFMGFAQKGGAVLSYVRLADKPSDINQVRIETSRADAFIACDMVVATSDKALDLLAKKTTRTVFNQAEVPTGDFVLSRDADMGSPARVQLLKQAVGDDNFYSFDANLMAEQLLGDSIFSNVIALGYSWQIGLVPVSLEAMLKAIELNKVAIDKNVLAFNWGRLAAADKDFVGQYLRQPEKISRETLDERIARHQSYLREYQNQRWADRYTEWVRKVIKSDAALEQTGNELSKAVAEQLFRLMSPKDEYEVARLYSQSDFRDEISRTFEGAFKLNLHFTLPTFRGNVSNRSRPKKHSFGPWVLQPLRWLAALKVLRGTPFDIFGYQADRRLERDLLSEYQELISWLVENIDTTNYAKAVVLADLPDRIRGFGLIKIAAAERTARLKKKLIAEFKGQSEALMNRAA